MPEPKPAPMTSADVRECLLRKWPESEYISICEAPQDAARQQRKLDVLVISLWKSRGFELDGVEIKVSGSDWKRELENAAKADWWWSHVHRFWVAVPATLVARVRDELPTSWGLLGCERDKAPVVVVKPGRHTPEPIAWPTTVGLLRASAGAGFNALQRAHQTGYAAGTKRGKEDAERQSGDAALRAEIERLKGIVKEFEAAAGVKLADWDAKRVGHLVAIVERHLRDPEWATRRLADAAKLLHSTGEGLASLAEELTDALATEEVSA